MTNREARSPALDGVRGVAILLVLFWHMYARIPRPGWTQNFVPLEWLANVGWSGVQLFFVLSGFLIARILLQHRGQPGYFRTFYLRRTTRIFPLYYLCIGSYLLVRYWLPPAVYAPLAPLIDNQTLSFWPYALFAQNYVMASIGTLGGHWLGVTWSLAVEEQFYLVLPLLIAFAPPAAFRRILLLLVMLAPLLRFFCLLTNSASALSVVVLLPTRIDGFALGALIALAVLQPSAPPPARIRLLTLIALLLFVATQMLLPRTTGPLQTALIAFNHTPFALVFGCLILWVTAIPGGRAARVLSARPLVWLGSASYFIYLFHQPVHYLVHWAVNGISPALMTVSGVATTLLALVILFGLAEVSRRFFEQPLIALGHRFSYGARDRLPTNASVP